MSFLCSISNVNRKLQGRISPYSQVFFFLGNLETKSSLDNRPCNTECQTEKLVCRAYLRENWINHQNRPRSLLHISSNTFDQQKRLNLWHLFYIVLIFLRIAHKPCAILHGRTDSTLVWHPIAYLWNLYGNLCADKLWYNAIIYG